MSALYSLLIGVIAAVVVIVVMGTQSEAVILFVRRRFSTFQYDGHSCLLMGLSLLAAFSLGLMVMYGLLSWR